MVIKPILNDQFVKFNQLINLIWIGIINPGLPWIIPISQILRGKLKHGLYGNMHAM